MSNAAYISAVKTLPNEVVVGTAAQHAWWRELSLWNDSPLPHVFCGQNAARQTRKAQTVLACYLVI